MNDIAHTLSLLKPEDLYPVWSSIDRVERVGEIPAADAVQWKQGIFGLMMLLGLEPDDLIAPLAM